MNEVVKKRAAWIPNPGSQFLFLGATWVDELLIHGTRGPGKTVVLLMDFAQEIGKGYGPHWRGVLFRQTYAQLQDVSAKAQMLFPKFFTRVKFNHSAFTWKFPGGEVLMLRYMNRPADYWNYHGHEYPWIGWEELTNWPTDECYEAMMACNRSAVRGVPKRVRSTCNPWGVGHHWVKRRFIDRSMPGEVVHNKIENPFTHERGTTTSMHLFGHIMENTHLIENDPAYVSKIISIRDENKRRAWLHGDWEISAGGYFADFWRETVNMIEPFTPPPHWDTFASFDWGSSKPFSLGLWTISDGEKTADGRQYKPGTMIRFDEWYGCQFDGRGEPIPNEGLRMKAEAVGKGIDKRLSYWEGKGVQFDIGVADPSIWTADGGESIYAMLCRGAGRNELFTAADNTRRAGWEKMAELMDYSQDGGPRLLVTENCRHGFLRTVPMLERSEKDPDDVNTDGEDHAGDEARYAVNRPNRNVITQKILGL